MHELGIESQAEWERQAEAALEGFDDVLPDLLGNDAWVRTRCTASLAKINSSLFGLASRARRLPRWRDCGRLVHIWSSSGEGREAVGACLGPKY